MGDMECVLKVTFKTHSFFEEKATVSNIMSF
ncbi:hypothetical protein BWGOE4_37610 [Bacillus mycoides]|uniref:Uncharacterized protein n=1 Tax=Bacillus mycoides TaxID=1405 RepID=A0A1E8BJW0_BACMY|nr:hypothetical protein IEM_01263 [Bacillus cereus BAG6O-2]OFD38520.1 hypothetical protein BWGOE2_37190 [Bacillus mycoides]OFD40763.1 hypothetical protein BWGOE3_37710 [Bacillus mycoides]OFD42964.1 hypothetical protein BWGOE1_37050 [Bacillus mycoides]OFD55106.1 hypothetical protein BWGOE4_37610 [Bacillus mycoides]